MHSLVVPMRQDLCRAPDAECGEHSIYPLAYHFYLLAPGSLCPGPRFIQPEWEALGAGVMSFACVMPLHAIWSKVNSCLEPGAWRRHCASGGAR